MLARTNHPVAFHKNTPQRQLIAALVILGGDKASTFNWRFVVKENTMKITGLPPHKPIPELHIDDIAKFYSLLAIGGPDDCWEWCLGKKYGYGKMYLNSRAGEYYSTHRLSYRLHYGVDPGKLAVAHRCDNPPCCNPKHLFLASIAQNNADRKRKGRYLKLSPSPTLKLKSYSRVQLDRLRSPEWFSAFEKMQNGFRSMPPLSVIDKERILSKIQRGAPDECWPWVGNRNYANYGVMRLGGKNGAVFLGHRLAYAAFNNQGPDGMAVLHKCDNPPCCNPSHLFLGSHSDNCRDKVNKGRQARGWNHYKTKLTEAVATKIRNRYSKGETLTSLSKSFGLSHSGIGYLVRGKTWKHVPILATQDPNKRHARGERVSGARFTADQVLRVRALFSTGDYSLKEIARTFKTKAYHIQQIVSGLTWRHIPLPLISVEAQEKMNWRKKSKLTKTQIREVKSKYKTGQFSQAQLGKLYSISAPTVSNIVTGKKLKTIDYARP